MTLVAEAEKPLTFPFQGCADLKMRVDAAETLNDGGVVVTVHGEALQAKAVRSGKRKMLLPMGAVLNGAKLEKVSTKWLLLREGDRKLWVSSLTSETMVTIAPVKE